MGSGRGVSSMKSLIGVPETLTPTAIAFIRKTIETAVAFSTSLHLDSRFSIPSRFAYGCSGFIDPRPISGSALMFASIRRNPG